MNRCVTGCALALIAAGWVTGARSSEEPPPAPREFRAVWVATVGNIDWPSRPGLSSTEQRREAIAILDRAAALNLNAVILQVRTAADALYESALEPWSAVLSGEQGQAPEPAYDPLAFWVQEAHVRGLQLHAWFNPFRAKPAGASYEVAEGHVSRTHPDWVRSYGGYLWMDPGEPEARALTLDVVADVLRRYDIDGVHIDDYFYPYPVAAPDGGEELDFPDDPTWAQYQQSGGELARPDWRRENINALVERMYRLVHEIKPGALFGISPFGIPRPGKPEGVVGFDQYAKLYADTERWLSQGWCDYWTPQLYWKIDAPGQPFRPLLDYWISLNEQGRHVWPGLSASRIGEGERGYAPEEILGQIAIIRETEGATGNVLFSMKPLIQDRLDFNSKLVAGPYRTDALVPETPWFESTPPPPPTLAVTRGHEGFVMTMGPGEGEPPFRWAIWVRHGDSWQFETAPGAAESIALGQSDGRRPDRVVVSAIDRRGNESDRIFVELEAD